MIALREAWKAGLFGREHWTRNLVAGDRNQASDVFLRDLRQGTTTLVSCSRNGKRHAHGRREDRYADIEE